MFKIPSLKTEIEQVERVVFFLHEIQETLESGLLPESSRWKKMSLLPAPWCSLIEESVQELRSRGAALLPTLRRLRSLAEDHAKGLKDARARSSQAVAQAMVCTALIPVFGSMLYVLLPGVDRRPWLWCLVCMIGLSFGIAAAIWLLKIAEKARWGGLKGNQKHWVLASQSAGERFLALVRSGVPGDLAWSQMIQTLDASLALSWGYTVWKDDEETMSVNPQRTGAYSGAAQAIVRTGDSIRKAIQVSLIEGRPCIERVEAVLVSLRDEMRACVQAELGLLSTRALQPLFFLVAPALFGLLVMGLYLGWLEASNEIFI